MTATRTARYLAVAVIAWAALCLSLGIGWGLSAAWGRSSWLFTLGVLLFGPVVLLAWAGVIGAWRMGRRT